MKKIFILSILLLSACNNNQTQEELPYKRITLGHYAGVVFIYHKETDECFVLYDRSITQTSQKFCDHYKGGLK